MHPLLLLQGLPRHSSPKEGSRSVADGKELYRTLGQTLGGEVDNPVQIHLAGNSQQFLGTARVFETQCKVF